MLMFNICFNKLLILLILRLLLIFCFMFMFMFNICFNKLLILLILRLLLISILMLMFNICFSKLLIRFSILILIFMLILMFNICFNKLLILCSMLILILNIRFNNLYYLLNQMFRLKNNCDFDFKIINCFYKCQTYIKQIQNLCLTNNNFDKLLNEFLITFKLFETNITICFVKNTYKQNFIKKNKNK